MLIKGCQLEIHVPFAKCIARIEIARVNGVSVYACKNLKFEECPAKLEIPVFEGVEK
jgi:hypothetical protein